ncbi:MAG: GIY-YIG nuclease family protein [Acidaminococcaceae bacterium]
MTAYVYMIRCKDGSLYTGWTNDLAARMQKHSSGKGAKYTRAFSALEMVYFEEVADKSAALKREYVLKQLKKEDKEYLVTTMSSKFLEKTVI